MAQLVLFNKPFNVLSQFTDSSADSDKRKTLADFISQPNVYPAGRLDRDSEGLLLLTDDGKLQQKISNPRHKLPKTYWVQVEGLLTSEALDLLRTGIQLKDGITRPAHAKLITPPPIWPRVPPIRERKTVPDCWLELTIKEGRNRQVRRMTAAAGFPTLRLIRCQIGEWQLGDLLPGESLNIQV